MSPEEQQRISSGEVLRLVLKHDLDLYDGDFKSPGLTTRMALVESTIERINKNLSRLVWMVVGAIVTGVATIIVAVVVARIK